MTKAELRVTVSVYSVPTKPPEPYETVYKVVVSYSITKLLEGHTTELPVFTLLLVGK